jgi:hypothetical protein
MRLAAMMGGEIRVESESARRGTCFYLTIKVKIVDMKAIIAESSVTPGRRRARFH